MGRNENWMRDIIVGQEAYVEVDGIKRLGRVSDMGREENLGGYDYIAVTFYADQTRPQQRRFAPEAVMLIDPTGQRRIPQLAREPKVPARSPRINDTPSAASIAKHGIGKRARNKNANA